MTVDFEKEIFEIKQSGEKRLYSKKILDGKQRIKFSILAHLNGLVSMSVVEEKNSYLCVSPICEKEIEITVELFEFFGQLVNKYISSMQDVEFYELQDKFELFCNNLRQNTVSGYKRYYEILQEHLFTSILALPNFKRTEKVVEVVREKASKKPGIVFAPKNDGLFCVSVDVKSSIFQGYKDLGVFEQETWEQFISIHTHDKLLVGSKNLRLSVLGKCNIFKNNQIIINNTITPTWNQIIQKFPDLINELLFLSGDEAVFGFQNQEKAESIKDQLIQMDLPKFIVISLFRLQQKFIGEKSYFLRHFTFPQITTDIKAASPEIIKHATLNLRNEK